MRQYALVKLTSWYSEYLKKEYPSHPLLDSPIFVYLGEIPNMPGHCAVAEYRGQHRVLSGYHLDDFQEISDDEI